MIRNDFPALAQNVNGRIVSYLDSAASAQKPQVVIDAMNTVMTEHYANVHRGVYTFGSKTSIAYENARKKVAAFLNAASDKEIVFTRNATEAINLVASSFGKTLNAGDEIILTELEHHANIVPWWFLKESKGVVLRVVPILENGALDMAAFDTFLSSKTKLVAVTQMSNALGTINPVAEMTAKAKAVGAKVLVDGSQAVVHLDVDVQKIGADFYVFTGHKLYGPTGIGVLYGRAEALESLPPYQGGGEMIDQVTFDKVTFKEPPYRFEAGTPAIVEAIGLGAAVDYYMNLCGTIPHPNPLLMHVLHAKHVEGEGTATAPSPACGRGRGVRDCPAIHLHEKMLLDEAEKRLSSMKGIKIWSTAPQRAAILSFTVDKAHPHDVATIFDQLGLAVRAGHHCAQPLMKKLGIAATVRASFAAYSDMSDVERLAEGLEKVKKIFA